LTSEAAINLKGWRRRVKSAQFFPDTIATGEHRYFVSSSAPQYLASGHVVAYVLAGRLFVVPFDDASSELRGAPVLVIERVFSSFTEGSSAVLYGNYTGDQQRTTIQAIRADGSERKTVLSNSWLFQDWMGT